jgi:hypothetical protein
MMVPKNDWSWCSGAINHFNIQEDLKNIIKETAHVIAANMLKPDYVHSSSSNHTPGWEDYTIQSLTMKLDLGEWAIAAHGMYESHQV